MGYEVMDTGRAPQAFAPDAAPVEIFHLDPGADEPEQGRARGARPDRPLPAWVQGLAGLTPRRRSVVLAVACLAVGAFAGGLVGGAVGQRRAERTQARIDQRSLAASAYATDITRYVGTGGPTVLLTVRVTNLGPLTLALVESPFDVEAARGRPVVRKAGSGTRVAPGADLDVSMTVAVDCVNLAQNVATVPLRTVDGTLHRVPVRSRLGGLDLSTSCTFSK